MTDPAPTISRPLEKVAYPILPALTSLPETLCPSSKIFVDDIKIPVSVLILPLTSNLTCGLPIPIPTLPPDVKIFPNILLIPVADKLSEIIAVLPINVPALAVVTIRFGIVAVVADKLPVLTLVTTRFGIEALVNEIVPALTLVATRLLIVPFVEDNVPATITLSFVIVI